MLHKHVLYIEVTIKNVFYCIKYAFYIFFQCYIVVVVVVVVELMLHITRQ
jgi:hypothetical protein